MKHQSLWICRILAIVLTSAAFVGCDLSDIPPPFNATGTYVGTYDIDEGKGLFTGDCGITLELVHLADIPLIDNIFAGLATLEWDCVLPEIVRDVLGITSDVFYAPVLAVLNADGSFSLELEFDLDEIPIQLQILIDTNDVEEIPLQNFTFSFTGVGEDMDGDGNMDSCVGTLVVHAEYELEGAQVVDLGGTFEATVVP